MKTKVWAIMALATMVSISSMAQENSGRFGIELTGGASFATQKLDGASLNTGAGFEGLLHYRVLPHTGLYAGWGWNRFAADNNLDYEETGYIMGLQFKHPIGSSAISYYLRAGALYNHIEIENDKGNIIGDTGHGWGWQTAAGVDLPLGSGWSLTPGVKFNSLSRELDQDGVTTDLNLNYLSARLGVMKVF